MIGHRMTSAQMADLILKWGVLLVAFGSALFALFTYRLNSRTKTAEFLLSLHDSFFVQQKYKKVRDLLDDDGRAAVSKIAALIHQESSAFTDFLNFFELITYFHAQRTLKRKDVEALLAYYLNLMSSKPDLRHYIAERKNGFEYLDRYLSKRASDRKRDV